MDDRRLSRWATRVVGVALLVFLLAVLKMLAGVGQRLRAQREGPELAPTGATGATGPTPAKPPKPRGRERPRDHDTKNIPPGAIW